MTGPRRVSVGIIGGGLAGLTLAAALRRHDSRSGFGVDVTVVERDAAWAARPQGYSIGLKGDAGLAVLRDLGLLESLTDDLSLVTGFLFADQRGRRLMELRNDDPTSPRATARIRRDVLRTALAELAGPVQLGRAATGFDAVDDGVVVKLADGDEQRVDWLVAADGVGSAIRGQLVGDPRHPLGLSAVVGDAPGLTVRHPMLDGGYAMVLGDDGSSVFVYPEPGGVHLSFTTPHLPIGRAAEPDQAALLARLEAATRDWSDPLPGIVRALDPASLVVRDYEDRDPLPYALRGRVWLIGDAAHPMAPFQGQGANLGMLDANDLAAWLGKGAPASEAEHLERAMVRRGRAAVLSSRRAATQFHTTSRGRRWMRDVGFRSADRVMSISRRRSSAGR